MLNYVASSSICICILLISVFILIKRTDKLNQELSKFKQEQQKKDLTYVTSTKNNNQYTPFHKRINLPYSLNPTVLTWNELLFYDYLKKNLLTDDIKDNLVILSQVNYHAFLSVDKKINANYYKNKISQKYIDFLICSSTFEPLCAIELDGSINHPLEKSDVLPWQEKILTNYFSLHSKLSDDEITNREHDLEKNAIFKSANLPLIRFFFEHDKAFITDGPIFTPDTLPGGIEAIKCAIAYQYNILGIKDEDIFKPTYNCFKDNTIKDSILKMTGKSAFWGCAEYTVDDHQCKKCNTKTASDMKRIIYKAPPILPN